MSGRPELAPDFGGTVPYPRPGAPGQGVFGSRGTLIRSASAVLGRSLTACCKWGA